ncbi:L-sorbosone dehydrogenase [FAD] [Roseomonas mucosa]|uniref:Putative membrane-bound dehydrogenase domain n=2 Tax=Roseomonas mucosa TaxID=207340 RepID=A0A379MWS3_9PROT|nr:MULTISPECIES: PQQ-dependent sugar dehydrogenase [Roseomonas]MCG7350909.1 PQQ-dependent sugar dehydrogenase [Roseomonas mucosa]MCG7356347.1 PQQ-dependent sugar dehydrogenase [Roseomonas mucosa]MDT8289176.1 PQQ-dependent sugar dehydrogenase [Roseomonas mucosa]MDT8293166.1 PQQ-dependent sugar dehydrogenase [Roseomonas mucosa]MDT8312917.1 PQQ-dependent sugar dehydrogenase [Roseomonas mucosa]
MTGSRKSGAALLFATLLAAAMPGPQGEARAQPAPPPGGDAVQKLQEFRGTGASRDMETVPQTGRRADQIRRNLERIRLPEGFRIGLYALVPDARHMAVGPSSGVVFVGTRKNRIWAVTDRDRDRVADEVKVFAPSVTFAIPNGLCFSPDGILYTVEQNRVLAFPAAEFFYEGPDVAAATVVPQGQLIPAAEESFNHTARVCRIGPDNKLHIALGQPFNVPPPAKRALYDQWGIGGIIRMDRDGQNREVFARGIRNSVGIAFRPGTSELWFTDNQVDGMGDDTPPGEINRATKAGLNFGFPWYGGGTVRTAEYAKDTVPADVVPPVVEMAPHAADPGMTFYTGRMFPELYRGAIFDAQHGSWNRSQAVGARVMVTFLNADGSVKESKPFAEGWLDEETNEYSGRPVDVAQLADGSLLVSDDAAGAIYRISYGDRN